MKVPRSLNYSRMKIRKISKEEDFFKLKESWNTLLFESGAGNIFLTWEWMYNWWKVFKRKNDELFILLGTENAEISGIAPCYISNGFYKKICFLGSGRVCSEYLSFIVSQKDSISFLTGICEYLNNNSDKWNLLYLEALKPDDKVVSLLKDCVNSKKWKWITLKEHISFYLPLLPSLEELRQAMSHSLIKKLLARKRKLSCQCRVECKELKPSNYKDLSSNFDIVFSLHQKRWQSLESKSGGVFNNKRMVKFLRRVTEEFYKNDRLSIYCLTLDGKPIAADYNLKFGRKIWCYTGGFEPLYKYYSPGSICFWESLQFYINNGYQEYDFLRGDETYKNRWTDKSRKECDILITKAGIKGSLFLLGNSFSKLAKNILKKILPYKMYAFLRSLKFNRGR